jgi:hypothetical protein
MPASRHTSETVSPRVCVGLTFYIIVFMASKGITHITLNREIKKDPIIKYFEGMF